MENVEHKIKNKLADADLSGISDSAKSRMWGGIESGMKSSATTTNIASKAAHMKVVHSRIVPVESVSFFARGIVPKLALASFAIVASIGLFLYFYNNEAATIPAVPSQSVDLVNRTNVTHPTHVDPLPNATKIDTESQSSAQSANPTELNHSNTERRTSNHTSTTFASRNKNADRAESSQNSSQNNTVVRSEAVSANLVSSQDTATVTAEGIESSAVSDDPSAAAKTRSKDTIAPKKKPVIIQTTEEIIIKKRSRTGKRTNH